MCSGKWVIERGKEEWKTSDSSSEIIIRKRRWNDELLVMSESVEKLINESTQGRRIIEGRKEEWKASDSASEIIVLKRGWNDE